MQVRKETTSVYKTNTFLAKKPQRRRRKKHKGLKLKTFAAWYFIFAPLR
jgi:hypothetical protein